MKLKHVALWLCAMAAAIAAGGESRAEASAAALPRVGRVLLDNGLTVLTLEDHRLPSVTVSIAYRVGSRNERPGITGISHLFEHMMFNGSAKFPPKAIDHIIERGGGYSNAFTDRDLTVYVEEFSPSTLDRVLEIEADRMRALKLDDANLEQERGIVINERLVRVDNSVEGTLDERLWAEALIASPYRWGVVGWMEDLQHGIRLEDAKGYFRTYYTPANAVMAIVGDFDTASTLENIRRLWAEVPRADPPRPVADPEPVQPGEKRVLVYKEAQTSTVAVAYKVPGLAGARAADVPALEVLFAAIGRGRSSPLYRRLVEETRLCTEASAQFPEYAMTGLGVFWLQLAPGKETAAAEKELNAILERTRAGQLTARDLVRARNKLELEFTRQFVSNVDRAATLSSQEALRGDWRAAFRRLDTWRAIRLEDLTRVAQTYLVAASRTVAALVPDPADEAVDFVALPKTGGPEATKASPQ